jgi:single stranded DNA-binding protein
MSINIDKAWVGGRITHQPIMRQTMKGAPATSIKVAINNRYRNGEGEWEKSTIFLDVQAYAKAAEFAVENLNVGDCVVIECRHQTRQVRDVETKRDVTIMELTAQQIHWEPNTKNKESANPTPQ